MYTQLKNLIILVLFTLKVKVAKANMDNVKLTR